jgi:hypothetical protein
VLVRPEVVVPGADEAEVAWSDGRRAGRCRPVPEHVLEGEKEALDAPVLPGGEGLGALVADADEPENRRKSQERTAGSLSVRRTLGVPNRSKRPRSWRSSGTVSLPSTIWSSRQARVPWSMTPSAGVG